MKQAIIALIVIILLVVNLWQWWPVENKHSIKAVQKTGQLSLLTLPLPDYSRNTRNRVLIDPFYGDQDMQSAEPDIVPQKKNKKTLKRDEDPFKHYQLAGILYKNGRMNAFMIVSGASQTVVKGDIINGNVLVERITESSVTLKHTHNKIKRTIEMR